MREKKLREEKKNYVRFKKIKTRERKKKIERERKNYVI
jgi:hypothetical protein